MGNHARILVIDDDPLFRSLIVSLLRKNYMVAVASDGLEGYHKALQHPPDIALVDIQMPGWDGLKTLKAFRDHPSLENTKILMLTGDASRETVLAAIQGGANDYVIKTSFSKVEFLEKISRFERRTNSINSPSSHKAVSQSTNPGTATAPALAVSSPDADLPSVDDPQLQDLMNDWK
jgi:two-component system copper resistance phosphate regulon response regulator CusR